LKEIAEIVEAAGGIGMLGTKHLLPDRQGPLQVGARLYQLSTGI
jgi:hypothetical protein